MRRRLCGGAYFSCFSYILWICDDLLFLQNSPRDRQMMSPKNLARAVVQEVYKMMTP